MAIAQDNYGFLWLGTDDGLYRYDGYTRPREIFECMAQHLGVRYRFGEAPAVSAVEPMDVRPERLAAVPDELRGQLREALVSLDAERILAAIERVSERDTTLGAVLTQYARRYAYTAMLEALEACEDPRRHDERQGTVRATNG